MSLIQSYYDPLHEFDRMFDDAITTRFPSPWVVAGSQGKQDNLLRPKMDVHEDPKTNTVTATFELPGLTKDLVSIDLHNNRLRVSGEVKKDTQRDEKGWAVRERSYGSFARTLQVPTGIKAEQIKASMEHGVLTVSFPKLSPEQSKKITIS